jgi:hypothetical protein
MFLRNRYALGCAKMAVRPRTARVPSILADVLLKPPNAARGCRSRAAWLFLAVLYSVLLAKPAGADINP